jgi:hypothetical protein
MLRGMDNERRPTPKNHMVEVETPRRDKVTVKIYVSAVGAD